MVHWGRQEFGTLDSSELLLSIQLISLFVAFAGRDLLHAPLATLPETLAIWTEGLPLVDEPPLRTIRLVDLASFAVFFNVINNFLAAFKRCLNTHSQGKAVANFTRADLNNHMSQTLEWCVLSAVSWSYARSGLQRPPFAMLPWFLASLFGFGDLVYRVLLHRIAHIPLPPPWSSRSMWIMGGMCAWEAACAGIGYSQEIKLGVEWLIVVVGAVDCGVYAITMGAALSRAMGIDFFTVPKAVKRMRGSQVSVFVFGGGGGGSILGWDMTPPAVCLHVSFAFISAIKPAPLTSATQDHLQ